MRIIKVNGTPVRVEEGCGMLPLRPCFVVSYALSQSYDVDINRGINTTIIRISGVAEKDLDALFQKINKGCDECFFGESMRVSRRQARGEK